MTDYATLLMTFAQIAAVFAGFAGIVAAFSTFRLAPEATAYRVRLLVEVALLVVLASLVPLVAAAFGISDRVSWRISALAFAVGSIGIQWASWGATRDLIRRDLIKTKMIATVIYIIGTTLTVTLLIIAAGGLMMLAPGLYMSALFFALALCCYYFTVMMLAIDLGKADYPPKSSHQDS